MTDPLLLLNCLIQARGTQWANLLPSVDNKETKQIIYHLIKCISLHLDIVLNYLLSPIPTSMH